MTKREKLIDIFAIEGFDYAKALSIIDKILALSEPTLGEYEIGNIIYDYCNTHGYDIMSLSIRNGLAKALSGRIAKPQEPECTCSIVRTISDDCPIHGQPEKKGRLEYDPHCTVIQNIIRVMEELNDHLGEK